MRRNHHVWQPCEKRERDSPHSYTELSHQLCYCNNGLDLLPGYGTRLHGQRTYLSWTHLVSQRHHVLLSWGHILQL